jgi:hypothetical protein
MASLNREQIAQNLFQTSYLQLQSNQKELVETHLIRCFVPGAKVSIRSAAICSYDFYIVSRRTSVNVFLVPVKKTYDTSNHDQTVEVPSCRLIPQWDQIMESEQKEIQLRLPNTSIDMFVPDYEYIQTINYNT